MYLVSLQLIFRPKNADLYGETLIIHQFKMFSCYFSKNQKEFTRIIVESTCQKKLIQISEHVYTDKMARILQNNNNHRSLFYLSQVLKTVRHVIILSYLRSQNSSEMICIIFSYIHQDFSQVPRPRTCPSPPCPEKHGEAFYRGHIKVVRDFDKNSILIRIN